MARGLTHIAGGFGCIVLIDRRDAARRLLNAIRPAVTVGMRLGIGVTVKIDTVLYV